jgi:hypothetical protein
MLHFCILELATHCENNHYVYQYERHREWFCSFKYLLVNNGRFSPNLNSTEVQKLSNEILKKIKNEDNTYTLIKKSIENIKEMIVAEELEFEDRKLFERKETTDKLKSYLIRNHESLITN